MPSVSLDALVLQDTQPLPDTLPGAITERRRACCNALLKASRHVLHGGHVRLILTSGASPPSLAFDVLAFDVLAFDVLALDFLPFAMLVHKRQGL